MTIFVIVTSTRRRKGHFQWNAQIDRLLSSFLCLAVAVVPLHFFVFIICASTNRRSTATPNKTGKKEQQQQTAVSELVSPRFRFAFAEQHYWIKWLFERGIQKDIKRDREIEREKKKEEKLHTQTTNARPILLDNPRRNTKYTHTQFAHMHGILFYSILWNLYRKTLNTTSK